MSAALLRNPKKRNELEDDRESCLHVLTWVALRFTKHTCSAGKTLRLLSSFDEHHQYEEGVTGGELKTAYLVCSHIPRTVKFVDRPQLDKLIKELTAVFSVRYEDPPSAEDRQAIRDLQAHHDAVKALVPESVTTLSAIMAELPASRYQTRLDNLKALNWLVDTFRRHLGEGRWPLSDYADGQLISTGSSSGKKRARDVGLRRKVQRLSDGSPRLSPRERESFMEVDP